MSNLIGLRFREILAPRSGSAQGFFPTKSLGSERTLSAMNLSGTIGFFKFLGNPPLGLPHATVNTFRDIPVEISKILVTANGGKPPDIRAIVLDKDNCFAKAKENVVYKPYEVC